ncbi:MarR family winged helix-turn-helix transcriptional regulator [Terrirubrum flagellatum]|uniref:MarR family winged helix-turn-helix transcriptional regulator n=1 Tax=Terrirubrum flagellatum TaxID=2895980 RepID=UPI003CC823A0
MRVWFRLARLHATIGAAITQRLRAIGLSIPQFDALSTLTEEDGITQQILAERLYVTKGNVSGLVNRLAEQGLVKRSPIAGDKRSHALTLTAKGRALAESGMKIQRSYVMATLGRMPAGEREMLGQLLVRLRDKVREEEACASATAIG